MSRHRQASKGKKRPRGWGQPVTHVRTIAQRLRTDPPRAGEWPPRETPPAR